MAETVQIVITVTYDVTDETELRAAAMADDGDVNYNPGDAAMHLWRSGGHGKVQLPGMTVVGLGMTREFHPE